MTSVRDRFAAVRMDTPAETIMARGSSLRRRRGGGRVAAVAAGALAVSLGAGLSVPALTAGTAAPAQRAALAAWTVHKHHDGSIGVTIRRWQNIGALQVKLGALGAPVIIVAGQAKPGRECALMWVRPAALQIRFARARARHAGRRRVRDSEGDIVQAADPGHARSLSRARTGAAAPRR